ncbi:MAG: hypothetical protein KDE45_16005, partial [Caldilineaceae bacterium]|nr:hypothetical protein [Caldilineaceae bacterium]
MTGRIHLRTVTAIEEVEHFQQLERLIWQSPAEDVVPVHVAITVIRNGGGLIAAFADDGPAETGGMIGLTFWFPGLGVPTTDAGGHSDKEADLAPRPSPLLKMCSHMAGVLPAWQGHGLGAQLKLAQRDAILAQGMTNWVSWTYDPLFRTNAVLNIRRLGALCNTYKRDWYGVMKDGLNAGVPSDRCQVDWWLDSARVEGRVARGEGRVEAAPVVVAAPSPAPIQSDMKESATMPQPAADTNNALGQALLQALQQLAGQAGASPLAPRPSQLQFDRNDAPSGSVVITGTGLGLPGANKPVMDPDNAMRILRGEQFVDLIPERFRKQMAGKRITRLVKSDDGGGSFEVIEDTDEVIKLAGRGGSFDLAEEYGVPAKLIEALDITTQLSIAAGLDALREAAIPLVQRYRPTSKGTYLPDRWMLPDALRDETGIIFASAFPGGDRMADEF